MPYVIRNLSMLNYANGFTLWHYRAASHRVEDVEEPGFFDEAATMVKDGDMMLISAADGGAHRSIAVTNGTVRLERLL